VEQKLTYEHAANIITALATNANRSVDDIPADDISAMRVEQLAATSYCRFHQGIVYSGGSKIIGDLSHPEREF
jgi:hypothetical protein